MITGAFGLLDTSTLILLPRLQDPAVLPERPLISAITLAELSVGPLVATIDADAARAFGQVAASLRRSGRKASARAYDAMIAAIAIANGLPLYTCNPDDFENIDGLTVIAVAHPNRPAMAG